MSTLSEYPPPGESLFHPSYSSPRPRNYRQGSWHPRSDRKRSRRPYYHVYRRLGKYWSERDYDGAREMEKGYDLNGGHDSEKKEGRIGKGLFPYPDRGTVPLC